MSNISYVKIKNECDCCPVRREDWEDFDFFPHTDINGVTLNLCIDCLISDIKWEVENGYVSRHNGFEIEKVGNGFYAVSNEKELYKEDISKLINEII